MLEDHLKGVKDNRGRYSLYTPLNAVCLDRNSEDYSGIGEIDHVMVLDDNAILHAVWEVPLIQNERLAEEFGITAYELSHKLAQQLANEISAKLGAKPQKIITCEDSNTLLIDIPLGNHQFPELLQARSTMKPPQ